MIQRGPSGGIVKGPTGKNAKQCGCTCTDCPDGLLSSYTVDLTGSWDISAACIAAGGSLYPCGGSDTFIRVENTGGCGFLVFQDSPDAPGFCVDGKAIRAVGLELGSNSLDCLQWAIEVVFYDGDGGEDSLHVFYRQRTDVCDDPTGIYDYDPASSAYCGDPALVPPSITVA